MMLEERKKNWAKIWSHDAHFKLSIGKNEEHFSRFDLLSPYQTTLFPFIIAGKRQHLFGRYIGQNESSPRTLRIHSRWMKAWLRESRRRDSRVATYQDTCARKEASGGKSEKSGSDSRRILINEYVWLISF